MVTNRHRETNRRYETNHAACFYQQRRLITATIQFFDLFSGIGGFREGLRRAGGFTCVGHCEVDTYADKNYRLLFDTEGDVLVKLFGNTLFGNHALYRNSIGVI
ncbi:hypothetical protein JCM37172_22740 [Faecalimonas hominis]